MSIAVNNLTKMYGAQKAVNGISFSVNKGEIVGFLGPNGAGKSTTMKIITGYMAADGGSAAVCGIPVSENSNATKTKIGYLPEANPLYFDMYVREYLEFVGNVHHVKDLKQQVEAVIDTVKLRQESGKKIGQLSKGYKQRVGLAAALIHDPEVLVLDEPTSGLDPNQIVEIREVIRELGKNKTVLFSSHIMQEVEAICDRVIIISKGTIVADDKLSKLQKSSGSQHIVTITFSKDVEPGLLKSLQHVLKMEQRTASHFQFTTESPDAVRKQLMELSLQNNWNIVSLQSENNSLEDVFRSLTTTKTN